MTDTADTIPPITVDAVSAEAQHTSAGNTCLTCTFGIWLCPICASAQDAGGPDIKFDDCKHEKTWECHRHSPMFFRRWPKVDTADWCGDFEREQ